MNILNAIEGRRIKTGILSKLFKHPRTTIASKNQKPLLYRKSNNCNGCSKQFTCEYGFYTYDRFEHRSLALWEKFLLVSCNQSFGQTTRPILINEYIDRFSKLKRPTPNDKEWLLDFLKYERSEIQKYTDFGKCGAAYVRYMGLNSQIKLIQEKLNFLK